MRIYVELLLNEKSLVKCIENLMTKLAENSSSLYQNIDVNWLKLNRSKMNFIIVIR